MPRKIRIGGQRDRKSGVAYDFPVMTVSIPSPAEVSKQLAKYIEDELGKELKATSGDWRNFANWLAGELVATPDAVTWPSSSAVERMGLVIDQDWMDEALQIVVDRMIRARG